MTATHRRTWVAVIAFVVPIGITGSTHANASSWVITTTGRAPALAHSLHPQPPGAVTASCASAIGARAVIVSWSSVSYARSYVVYQSTTSAMSGFTPVATDVTTTTWITATLKKGTYWYAVAAVAGSPTWTSSMSSPTQARTITTNQRCT